MSVRSASRKHGLIPQWHSGPPMNIASCVQVSKSCLRVFSPMESQTHFGIHWCVPFLVESHTFDAFHCSKLYVDMHDFWKRRGSQYSFWNADFPKICKAPLRNRDGTTMEVSLFLRPLPSNVNNKLTSKNMYFKWGQKTVPHKSEHIWWQRSPSGTSLLSIRRHHWSWGGGEKKRVFNASLERKMKRPSSVFLGCVGVEK